MLLLGVLGCFEAASHGRIDPGCLWKRTAGQQTKRGAGWHIRNAGYVKNRQVKMLDSWDRQLVHVFFMGLKLFQFVDFVELVFSCNNIREKMFMFVLLVIIPERLLYFKVLAFPENEISLDPDMRPVQTIILPYV